MPNHVDGVLVRAMSGIELSRVRTEFRLHPPEPINQSLPDSRGRIVMQSFGYRDPRALIRHVQPKTKTSDLRRRALLFRE